MKIGLAYDLKEAIHRELDIIDTDDCLEEYDSQETVDALADTIGDLGHQVTPLGGGKEFVQNILREPVDFVFNIAEGRGSYRSREAQIPSILEMLSVPYFGSDPQCLAICLDKPLTKTIVSTAGIHTPQWRLVANREELADVDWKGFSFPAFFKVESSSSSANTGAAMNANTIEASTRNFMCLSSGMSRERSRIASTRAGRHRGFGSGVDEPRTEPRSLVRRRGTRLEPWPFPSP